MSGDRQGGSKQNSLGLPKKKEESMLSTTKYASLCVLGIEVFYVLCLFYEFLLPAKRKELHRALFELLPGFVWGNILSMVWGAVFLAIAAWITGSYIS
jgi:hypothetical protein